MDDVRGLESICLFFGTSTFGQFCFLFKINKIFCTAQSIKAFSKLARGNPLEITVSGGFQQPEEHIPKILTMQMNLVQLKIKISVA